MDPVTTIAGALELFKQGREIFARVSDAIHDGKVAHDTTSLEELKDQLAQEEAETRAASAKLQAAIDKALAKL